MKKSRYYRTMGIIDETGRYLISLKSLEKKSKASLLRLIMKYLKTKSKKSLAQFAYNMAKTKLPILRTTKKALPKRKTKRKFSKKQLAAQRLFAKRAKAGTFRRKQRRALQRFR